MIRYVPSEVVDLLSTPQPDGMIDLWDALPEGAAASASAIEAARRSSQTAIVQGLSLIEQKVTAAAGLSVGFRPEIFEQVRALPGFDTLAATAELAITSKLDLASVTTAAKDLVIEILQDVGALTGSDFVQAGYLDGLGPVVAVVMWAVDTIVSEERKWKEYQEAQAAATLDCAPPAYSAKLDAAMVADALALVAAEPDWRDLFLPEARVFDPTYAEKVAGWGPDSGFADDPGDGWRGFTCCTSTVDGGRVIAPVGIGIGNRIQSSFTPIFYGSRPGFGLLPMCPDLPCHRAVIVTGSNQIYDPGRSLPQLAGVGQRVWRILWGRGPAAFAVDGASIAAAWSEYFQGMRDFIGRNRAGIGGHPSFDNRVCDDWGKTGRTAALRWIFSRIGASGAEDTDGIYSWSNALPVKAWRAYEDYQESMLARLVIFLVDARTCAPEWRERVRAAQAAAVDSHPTAVCEIDPDDIPDPDLRAAVKARRLQKGAQCYAVAGSRLAAYGKVSPTNGPSLAPLGEDPPEIPEIPELPPLGPLRATTATAGGGGGGAIAAVIVAAAAAFLLSRSRR